MNTIQYPRIMIHTILVCTLFFYWTNMMLASKNGDLRVASYGAMIRQWRSRQQWSQRTLAEAIGVTSGYVALLENESKIPSLDLCLSIILTFQLTPREHQGFLEAIERARRQETNKRASTRSAVVRDMLEARGSSTPSPPEPPTSQPPSPAMSVEEIARAIASDDVLRAAFRDLQVALDAQETRQTVLDTLRLFAERARTRIDTEGGVES